MISEKDFNIDIVPSTIAEKETLSLTNFLRYRIKKPNIESRISLPQPAHMTWLAPDPITLLPSLHCTADYWSRKSEPQNTALLQKKTLADNKSTAFGVLNQRCGAGTIYCASGSDLSESSAPLRVLLWHRRYMLLRYFMSQNLHMYS